MWIGNEKLEARDYFKFLVNYALQWRSIGLKLGLQSAVLDLIGADHPNQYQECFRLTLDRWLQQDINATWSTLELAITNANRESLGIHPLNSSKAHVTIATDTTMHAYI